MEPALAKIPQAAGVVKVPVGHHHLDRLVCDLPDHLGQVAVGEPCVHQQGAVRPHKEKLPHPAVIQQVEILLERDRLYHCKNLLVRVSSL